jgi:phage shock protein C
MKKLKRSKKRVIAGICGGLAEYFAIDPTLVRLIWAVATVASMGLGIIAYLVAWVIIPE